MCACVRRLRVHAQNHLFASRADQGLINIWEGRDRGPVDGENVIAGFNVHAHRRERRARVLVPVFARQNVVDPVSACGRVAGEFRAQQTELHPGSVGPLAAADVSVAAVQFTDQFAEQISEIVAVVHERHEHGVFIAHRFPVDAVHRRRIEEIPHVPPAFEIDLVPLGVPVELQVEAFDLVLVVLGFDLVLGQIDDRVIFFDFYEHLFPIECDLVIVHIANHRFFTILQAVSAEM